MDDPHRPTVAGAAAEWRASDARVTAFPFHPPRERRTPARSFYAQARAAETSRDAFQVKLGAAGFGASTTELRSAPEFWYAEDYHQQYLHKNPNGYCGLGGTGVSCPTGGFVSR